MNVAVIMPDMGENIDRGIVTRVEVATGDAVEIGQTLIEVESDKVILEVPAELSGRLEQVTIKEGDTIKPGEQFAIIVKQNAEDSILLQAQENNSLIVEAAQPENVTRTDQYQKQIHNKRFDTQVYAGPSAQRMARDLGVSLPQISGTGAQGRISVNDVKVFVRHGQHQQKKPTELALPDFSADSTISREHLDGIGRTTARNMRHVWNKVPHAWVQLKADVTQLETIRKRQNSLNNTDLKLSLTVFLLKMLAQTLKHFPRFNACYDETSEELILKKEIHLGLAIDTSRGLFVPVIKNIDLLSMNQVAGQFNELVAAGRVNQLRPEQLRGGGMTLSNLGGMGIESLCPLINWPEVAILGAGAVTVEPVWKEERFVPCSMLTLVLGFDHRVINGADAARFLTHLKKHLENPFLAALS